MRRVFLMFLLTIFLFSLLTTSGFAKYPEKTIEMIVGYSAGGSTDVMARLIAEGIKIELGQKVIVINKPGAAGEIGWTDLAHATPDGYTIGTANLPGLITNVLLRPDTIQYAVDDFEAIANIVLDSSTFTVPANSPFQNLTDLIEYAKEHPKAVTIGNSGVGSSGHTETLYFNSIMDLETTPVPFEGDAPVRAALLGGHIMCADIKISEADPYLEEGTLRVIGIMAEERLPDYPEIPTFNEQGINMVAASARGIIMPKGATQDVIDTLSNAIEKVVKSESFVMKAKDMNMPLQFMPPEEYKVFFESQEEFTKRMLVIAGQID